LKISLMDKIFEILAQGLALESPVSLTIIERAVVFHSKTGKIMLLWFQPLHPGLTLDGFKTS